MKSIFFGTSRENAGMRENLYSVSILTWALIPKSQVHFGYIITTNDSFRVQLRQQENIFGHSSDVVAVVTQHAAKRALLYLS